MVELSADSFALLVSRLRAAGCVYAEEEAAHLVGEASTAADLTGLVDRRVGGEPLEYVLGWAEFCGLRLVVAPGAFVPRRRTEFLARQAIDRVGPAAVVVDLCCGVGAVAAAVEAARDDVETYAADLDPVAVDCARRNVRGVVLLGDLYEPLPPSLRSRVDLLVANAPYVPTDEIRLMPPEARDHEHRVALDGGGDGLDIQRRVVTDAPDWLAPGGVLLIETGARQAVTTADLMSAAGLRAEITSYDDLGATVVIGTRG